MNSTEIFAIIGLITSLGYLGFTMSSGSIKNDTNTITSGGNILRGEFIEITVKLENNIIFSYSIFIYKLKKIEILFTCMLCSIYYNNTIFIKALKPATNLRLTNNSNKMNARAIERYFQHLDQQGMALLAENYAWVDERLENQCLQQDDQEQAEEEELSEVIPMDISDDEDEGEAVVPIDISDDEDEEDDEYQLAPIQLFPAMDEHEENEDLVLDMALLQLPGPPALRRSNTICYQDDNVTVYNGNPNGSRFFDHDSDVDDE